MKKILFSTLLIILSFQVKAQFSLQTEIAYLQHINSQERADLVEDNLINAEGKLEEVLNNLSDYSQFDIALFLIELSRSYQIASQAEIALHRILMQRCLFPVDSLNKYTQPYFEEISLMSNLNLSDASNLWQSSSEKFLSHDFNIDLLYFIKISTELHLKKIQPYILQTNQLLRARHVDAPLWLDEWVLFTKIKLKERHKKLLIDYEKDEVAAIDLSKIKDVRLRKKVYRKSIKYYLRTNSFSYAKEVVETYKKEEQNVFESLDLCIKKLRISLKW